MIIATYPQKRTALCPACPGLGVRKRGHVAGVRWLTVRPEGSEGQELLLMDPAHSMLDATAAEQVRALVAKGALSPGVMATSDCRADHRALSAAGVQFLQEPATRPYGIEAVLRDDSGNWYSFTQRTA